MSKFQITVIGVFVIAIIGGVIAFATFKGNNGAQSQLPPITVWGTFPADKFTAYVAKINQSLSSPITINYVEKSQSLFPQDFINALARGNGPDAILIPADMLLPQLDKIQAIPYTALPQRTFMDTYINEAQMYLSSNGILAMPFVVDPLMMYWNKDTFASAGLATYPKYWDEFAALNRALTVKDQNGNIRHSAIALGDFANVANAREILGTLLLQTGNTVVARQSDGSVASALDRNTGNDPSSAISFFAQFANPSGNNYSWNRGMPNSKLAFLSGSLATYFGFASEIGDIRDKNPNLNFDVAAMPQLRNGGDRATYGRLYGLSIVRASVNQNAAFQIFSILTSQNNLATLSNMLYLPSVNSVVIAGGSNDPYMTIFDRSALIGKAWLDIDQSQSFAILGNMIGAITSGARTVDEAIRSARDQYNVAIKQALQ
ncbi:MAG: extracellular solute-binding protein [Patescibacteria group bacterium]|nr:extracellular solute-binding protein [Patescibacteria group bacterium]